MAEIIEITTPDDQPRLFVADFSEPSKITSYGVGHTPLVAVRDLLQTLREERSLLDKKRGQLGAHALAELTAIESFLSTFQETPCRKKKR
jgi:hypothetical protein